MSSIGLWSRWPTWCLARQPRSARGRARLPHLFHLAPRSGGRSGQPRARRYRECDHGAGRSTHRLPPHPDHSRAWGSRFPCRLPIWRLPPETELYLGLLNLGDGLDGRGEAHCPGGESGAALRYRVFLRPWPAAVGGRGRPKLSYPSADSGAAPRHGRDDRRRARYASCGGAHLSDGDGIKQSKVWFPVAPILWDLNEVGRDGAASPPRGASTPRVGVGFLLVHNREPLRPHMLETHADRCSQRAASPLAKEDPQPTALTTGDSRMSGECLVQDFLYGSSVSVLGFHSTCHRYAWQQPAYQRHGLRSALKSRLPVG